jgi:hypothetical protein
VSTSTLGFDLQFVTALHIRGCNLYDDDTVFKFLVANHVSVTDTAIETFETAALFDNTSAALAVLSVLFHNCRFVSTSGGESNSCRIVKSHSNANFYQGVVRGLVLRDCSFWLTNSKYVIEVNWNNHLSGGTNRFVAGLYNNYLQGESNPLNTIAWFKSDSTYVGFVHVDFGNNHAPNEVLVQDGGEPIVTGYAHRGLDAGSIPASSSNGAGVLWGLNRWGEDGSNTRRMTHGLVQLASGRAAVSHLTVTTSSRIFVQTIGPANAGWLVVQNVLPGKSFDIVSSNGSDGSVVAWLLVEP